MINTPHAFALAHGWSREHIEATSALGVSDTDLDSLAETGVSPADLLAWCRARVAEREASPAQWIRVQYAVYASHADAIAVGWEDAEFGCWQFSPSSPDTGVEGWIALTREVPS